MARTYHVEVNDKKYLVNENYHLVKMDSYDEDIRDWIADRVEVSLSEEHIAAIEFIRNTYARRQQHPNPRVIAASLASQYGEEHGTLKHFYSLFPKGVKQAFAVAGVPMQGFCF
jgi:TusE/DsrC/DsvC family sulfur relay protein